MRGEDTISAQANFPRKRERLTANRICLFRVEDAGRSVAAASGAISLGFLTRPSIQTQWG
jgi:hypothetical protein